MDYSTSMAEYLTNPALQSQSQALLGRFLWIVWSLVLSIFRQVVDDRQRLFWCLQAVGWGGTLVVAVGMAAFLPVEKAILLSCLRALFGVVATTFLLRPIYRRIRRNKVGLSWSWALGLFLLCGVLGGVDAFFVSTASHLLQIDFAPSGMDRFLVVSIFMRSGLYVFWTILYFGVHAWLDGQQYQLQVARAEASLRSSELQLLRSQVDPHFLFNALNSILSESGNPKAVEQLTLALSEYLRFSLSQHEPTNTLGIELDALQNYLNVEKVRFEGNLEYQIDASEESRHFVVPIALVQPLLENAIKYGQRSNIRPLKIEIRTHIENGTLHVSVENTGSWIPPAADASGIGLNNLRRRLILLYGDEASLAHEESDGRVCVHVSLPLLLPS